MPESANTDELTQSKRKDFDDDNDDFEINEIDPKRFSHLSYIDRYYTKYYKLDKQCENNPHILLYHSNRVCILTLPESHPLLQANTYKIMQIEFIQNISANMKGKRKHNANFLESMQPLCTVRSLKLDETPQREQNFTIYSIVNGKLIEINERLLKDPEILQTKTQTLGYIAIIYPKIENIKKQLDELVSHSEYVNLCAGKK
jgi:hypothetical protein